MDEALSPYEASERAATTPPTRRPVPVGFILRKILWVVALVTMGAVAMDGFLSFELQTGAPQQAASAAWSSFQIVTVYVVARGLDELTRGQNGV